MTNAAWYASVACVRTRRWQEEACCSVKRHPGNMSAEWQALFRLVPVTVLPSPSFWQEVLTVMAVCCAGVTVLGTRRVNGARRVPGKVCPRLPFARHRVAAPAHEERGWGAPRASMRGRCGGRKGGD